MKAKFRIPFDNNLPFYLDEQGNNLITGASRASGVDGQGNNEVIIEASQVVIDALKIDPAYEWIEDIVDS